MDSINKTANSIENYLKMALSNVYVLTSIKVFLVLYAAMAAPALPKYIANLFNNTLFRILIASIIVYMSTHDPTIAILVAVGFIISLQTLNKHNVNNIITNTTSAKNIVDVNNTQSISAEEMAHMNSPYFTASHVADKLHPASATISDNFSGSEEVLPQERASASFTSPQQFADAQDNRLLKDVKGVNTFTNQITAQGDGGGDIGPYDKSDISSLF